MEVRLGHLVGLDFLLRTRELGQLEGMVGDLVFLGFAGLVLFFC